MLPWLLSAGALAVQTAFGSHLLARLLDEDRLEVLLPAGALLGAVSFTLLENAAGRILGVAPAATLILLGMAAWACARMLRTPPRFRWTAGRLHFHLLWSGAAILGVLVVLGGLTTFVQDADFHLPVVATIANGNLPVRDPFVPERMIEYHFGANLCAGALAAVTGLPAVHAFVPVLLLFHVGTWGVLLALGRGDRSEDPPLAGMLVAVCVTFGAGFRFLELGGTPFAASLGRALHGAGPWPGAGELAAAVDLPLLANDLYGPLASCAWSPPYVAGMGVFLLFILFSRAALSAEEPAVWAASGVVFSALELFRQDLFVLSLPALACIVVLRARRDGGAPWRALATVVGVGLGIALVQGAVVTTLALRTLGLEPDGGLAFALKEQPHWVIFDLLATDGEKLRRIYPGASGWTWPFLRDAALAFLCAVPALVWAVRRNREVELFAGIVFGVGVALALFLDVPLEPRATLRLLEIPAGNLLAGGGLAAALAWGAAGVRWRRAACSALVWGLVAVCALPSLGYVIGTVRWGLRENPLSRLPAAEVDAGRWLRRQVPFGARVAGLDPAWSGHLDLAGYIRSRKWKYPRRSALLAALAERDTATLVRLGVEYAVFHLHPGERLAEAVATFGDDPDRLAIVRLPAPR